MPLRFVFRPGRDALLGLMPAHRGGTSPALLAQGDRDRPGQRARGLDPHQGAVLLHDGETGVLQARAQRLGDHRDPDGRGLGGRDASSWPGREPDASRSSARASRGARTREAMRAVVDDPELRIWSRTPRTRRRSRSSRTPSSATTVEEALDGADDRLHVHGGARADRPARVARARRPRQRRRRPRCPTARELDGDVVADASLFVDRRESTAQRVGRLPAAPPRSTGIGPDAHPRRARRGAGRRAPGAAATTTS